MEELSQNQKQKVHLLCALMHLGQRQSLLKSYTWYKADVHIMFFHPGQIRRHHFLIVQQ